MNFLRFMQRIRLLIPFLLLCPFAFADYQIKSEDVRVDSSKFTQNLSENETDVQKTLEKIDKLALGTTSGGSPEVGATVTRDGNGVISQVAYDGGPTIVVTRTNGVITSFTKNGKTWTISRDGSGFITGWTVA